jgi:protein-S-isoprenylcysteine O-methyltransferase Ste14
MGAVLFGVAGTFEYEEGWAFLSDFVATGLAIALYLMRTAPRLLERRLQAGPGAEKELVQKIAMSLASVGFLALLAVSAFDYRLHSSSVSFGVSLLGDALIVAGLAIVWRVFRENSFTSATIEVAAGQKVVSTGPYAVVRHPMYAGSLLYLVAIPIALGSWWGLAVMLFMLPVLVWRLRDEEKFLAQNLPGYSEYQALVKFRLVPFVW